MRQQMDMVIDHCACATLGMLYINWASTLSDIKTDTNKIAPNPMGICVIPNPIITLYYAQLFPLVQIQIQIPVRRVSRMVSVPILGTDLRPRDPNPSPLVEMSHKCRSGQCEHLHTILFVLVSVYASVSVS